MVQKAVELGVSRLQPVTTRHTQTERVNTGRMVANAIEAAEQCGILNLPDIRMRMPLATVVGNLEPSRTLVFCDEDAPTKDPAAALSAIRGETKSPSIAVLIGPEGGFEPAEQVMLARHPGTIMASLGKRVLRAETAAIVGLALLQAAGNE